MLEDTKDGKTRWVAAAHPGDRGHALPLGRAVASRATSWSTADGLRTLYKMEPGEWYSRKKIDDGNKKAQEVYGSARLHGVDAVRRCCKSSDDPEQSGDGARLRWCPPRSPRPRSRKPAEPRKRHVEAAGRGRDDADHGRAAVLRQPHHVHRQHHDARQRDPPRDAADRRQRLRHRGAEVQRPPSEPARLLQGAEGQRQRHEGRQDARQGEQRRRHAEVRGAEPQPADLRRRRVAVRGRLRPARVPDVELPRPRREPDGVDDRPATARRTISWRSPSRSCSTATSPAASTSTSGRCSTSATTRRSPPAATWSSGSRSPTSAACSSTTRTRRSR